MRIAVYRPGHTTPLHVADSVDDCLEWIGEQVGCNWATHLAFSEWEDGSFTVFATRTQELLEFTIAPAPLK